MKSFFSSGPMDSWTMLQITIIDHPYLMCISGINLFLLFVVSFQLRSMVRDIAMIRAMFIGGDDERK